MTEINKDLPLMRKATAVWLVDNTALSFKQIAQFCGLHELEIQGIADGDVAKGIIGQNPISSGQLNDDDIAKCEQNHELPLIINQDKTAEIKSIGKKTGKYTPVARRQDKPDGIAYLLKYYPEITNAQIRKLVGTTDEMIDSIRNKSHWNMKNIKPRDVVLLGLCNQSLFNDVIATVKEQSEKTLEKKKNR
ncbi:MAG TPA: cell cycle transcriptional regulator TrcR [Rickettsiales bacterium]|nr:cell cycle transcriptional regulator TrcR [Rickettsiales bacterium]